jgi:hypothetical protein
MRCASALTPPTYLLRWTCGKRELVAAMSIIARNYVLHGNEHGNEYGYIHYTYMYSAPMAASCASAALML